MQRSIWQSEEALEGVGESDEDSAEEKEKEEEDGEECKASDTLLQELWNDCSLMENAEFVEERSSSSDALDPEDETLI